MTFHEWWDSNGLIAEDMLIKVVAKHLWDDAQKECAANALMIEMLEMFDAKGNFMTGNKPSDFAKFLTKARNMMAPNDGNHGPT